MSSKKYISPKISKKRVRVNQFFNSRFFDSFDMLLTPNAVFATSHGSSGSASTSTSSGCNACLVSGTKILIENKNERSIESLKIGDKVLCFDYKSEKLRHSLISNIEIKMRIGGYFVLNNVLGITDDHPLYVCGYGFKKVRHLVVGDRLMRCDGSEVILENIKHVSGVHKVYNPHMSVESGAYFADGFLVKDYWAPQKIKKKSFFTSL